MGHAYLIRYGVMRRVGRFLAASDSYNRGQTVVVQSRRGMELGEVLLETPADVSAETPTSTPARVLRAANTDDLERARQADLDRIDRLAACEQIFRDGIWPLELIDVEPLLDGRRTVLHYLGPHHLDVSGLWPIFRDACDLDVVFEPAGIDADDEPRPDPGTGHGCDACSAGGECGAGRGCSNRSESESGGCASCRLPSLRGRQPMATR